jgi:hypothetical protein
VAADRAAPGYEAFPDLKSAWVRLETTGGEAAIDDLSVVKG